MTEKELIQLLRENYIALDESIPQEGFNTFKELKDYVEDQEAVGELGDTLVLFVVRNLSDCVEDGEEINLEQIAEQIAIPERELSGLWSGIMRAIDEDVT